MSITFAANLNKMITAGLGGAVDAPDTHVAVGHHVERKTVSGNPIAITDGAKNQPVESCVVSFSPVQDTSNGDPSPDNICPISGWDALTVTLNDTAHTISLPATVYGGSLDIVSGQGSSAYGYVDLGTLTWYQSNTDTTDIKRFASSDIASTVKNVPNATVAKLACTIYKPITADGSYTKTQGIAIGRYGDIYIYDERYNTADATAAFKAAMSGVMLCYELATPTPITTDPVEMTTLEGDNTIFTDADSLTVTYQCITYTEGY